MAKLKIKGNGHKSPTEVPVLDTTEEMVEAITRPPQEPAEDHRLAANFVENSMRQADQETALGLLVKPGDSIQDILMRADIPSKTSEGTVKAMSAIHIIMQCREDGDILGEQEVWYDLSLLPSVDGKRARMLVEAVTGNMKGGEDSSGAMAARIKKYAYGNKEQS